MILASHRTSFPPAYLDALAAAVFAQAEATPHSSLSVGTGWSGPKTLFANPAFDGLRALVDDIAQNATGESFEWCAWANIMRRGDRVDWHAHERSHLGGPNVLAGVFYLTQPDARAGLFCYTDANGDIGWLSPERGLLVVFTADTAHKVTRHDSDAPRISIAFNGRRPQVGVS